MPIFATSKSRITYTGKFNSTDDRETEMMSVRWKFIEFTHRTAENEQKQVAQSSRYFAELTFLGENCRHLSQESNVASVTDKLPHVTV